MKISEFFLVKIWGFFVSRGSAIEIMGGKQKQVEPPSCVRWKKNSEVWDILRLGNFTGYMERLKGNNPAITHQFVKS